MHRCARLVPLFAVLVLLGAAPAVAQIDVELGFEPTQAAPGDEVAFFASIANLGDMAVDAGLDLTVSFGGFEVGPISGTLPLAAGEELSAELNLVIPDLPTTGTLTISVTATAGEFSDTATASLTLVEAASGGSNDGLQTLADAIAQALGSEGAVGTEAASFGELKANW